ncbi:MULTISPECIES: N-acetylglucosamine kinase [Phyllobacteriaceae]|uniref:N-acetylglucosamine kinase n=2 Tax=Pseudomonadota TaxID=1224 RepID=A0A1C2E0W7_9HYPH|nr:MULTISPECIES: BadF/BadG/BcrA/BcrD ATPase family protein [Mesorhizobium]MBN9235465.1 N-acetylglucosamine kinase [Mesorhizobium sp.]MDQ0331382.1 N-acetylglucosamine kinase-like BadF-type ATPase [Mesorhizobium sp. YL-MeA3-2017]OCX20618.1 N-acetylglucosamine kinase [Mesorhizobium hungaricum]
MKRDLILGIDGGGSKILVALADRSGRLLRLSRGGGVNPMDNPGWRQELDAQLAPFVGDPRIGAVAAALPAYSEVKRLSEMQRDAISCAFGDVPQRILNDVEAAHLGAFAGGAGILLLSGTGSMAWARDATGVSFRVGGWGDAIGDEGSGYWIGRAALNLVSQSIDGRARPTALADMMFEHLQIDRSDPMNALGGWVTGLANPRSGIAALSTLVDRAAGDGDAGALDLIERAADELAKHFAAISATAGHNGSALGWTYAGGTFASRRLLDALCARIDRPLTAPKLPPIGGALLAAAQLLGWLIDDSWIGQLAAVANSATEQTGEAGLNNKERREHA